MRELELDSQASVYWEEWPHHDLKTVEDFSLWYMEHSRLHYTKSSQPLTAQTDGNKEQSPACTWSLCGCSLSPTQHHAALSVGTPLSPFQCLVFTTRIQTLSAEEVTEENSSAVLWPGIYSQLDVLHSGLIYLRSVGLYSLSLLTVSCKLWCV